MIVTAAGTGTVALMPRSGGLLHWLYSGQHMSAAVAYNRELAASMNAQGYFLILLFFPVIGLILGAAGSSWAVVRGSGDPGSPPGGPPGLEPAPDPPGGGQASLPAGTRQAPRGSSQQQANTAAEPSLEASMRGLIRTLQRVVRCRGSRTRPDLRLQGRHHGASQSPADWGFHTFGRDSQPGPGEETNAWAQAPGPRGRPARRHPRR